MPSSVPLLHVNSEIRYEHVRITEHADKDPTRAIVGVWTIRPATQILTTEYARSSPALVVLLRA